MKILKFLFLIIFAVSSVLSYPILAEFNPTYAIVGCKIVPGRGPQIEKGIIIIRDGLIEELGPAGKILIPEDAEVIEAEGLYAYPGLIDAHTSIMLETPKREPQGPGRPASPADEQNEVSNWQHTDFMAINHLKLKKSTIENFHKVGITTICIAPDKSIFAGQSVILNLSGEQPEPMVIKNPFALHINFVTVRGEYPSSLMGTMSLLRQSILDTEHYHLHSTQYLQFPGGLKRPVYNPFLEKLRPYVVQKKPIVFNCANMEDIKRALRLTDEFKLNAYVSGANEAWRVSEDLKKSDVPLFVSLRFNPPLTSIFVNQGEDLKKKAENEIYPANASHLHREGIEFSLTSSGLTKPGDIIKNVQKAIKAGLPQDAALKAMTLNPAKSLGIDKIVGSLEAGKIANVVLATGALFEESSKIQRVFVDGISYTIKQPPKGAQPSATSIAGKWDGLIKSPMGELTSTILFQQEGDQITGTISSELGNWEITGGVLSGNTLSFTIAANIMGNAMEMEFSGSAERDVIEGSISTMAGNAELRATRIPEEE